jgi:hypothetical protein
MAKSYERALLSCLEHIRYIQSVLVQDFVSGRCCCVNQYNCESRYRRVVIWIVHAICKNWNIVLYQHILYEISLFSISMKTHFKQITRIELKLTNLDTTLRVTTFSWWRHVMWCHSFTNRTCYYSINFSVSVHPFDNAFCYWNVDLKVAGTIKTMSLEMQHRVILLSPQWLNELGRGI